MYKLLIVEDEYIIRKGLRKTIPWQKIGYEVVGEAEDGQKAFEKISEVQPDVVLTDIRMPNLDGIELLREIKAKHPAIKVVLLSGYEDFKYAKSGISLGAEDYILKLMLDSDLQPALIKVKEKLDKEREKEASIRKVYDERENLHCNILFNGIINDTIREKELLESCTSTGVDFINGHFCVAFFYVDFLNKDLDNEDFKIVLDYQDIFNLSEIFELLQNDSFLLRRGKDVVVVHYGKDDISQRVGETWQRIVHRIRSKINDKNLFIHIGIGDEVIGWQGIGKSHAQARKSVLINATKENSINVTSIHDVSKQSQEQAISAGDGTELLRLLVSGDKQAVYNKLDAMMKSTNLKANKESFRYFILEFIAIGIFKLREMGLSEINQAISIIDISNKMQNAISLRDMREIFLIWLNEAISIISEIKKRPVEQSVQKAIEYLENHFNERLTLENVSNHVYLSPTYFSTVFKKHTGQSFKNYLAELRMEKAREFLKNGYMVNETAMLIGYSDVKHFGKMFKKHNDGLNPSEYRSRFTEESEE